MQFFLCARYAKYCVIADIKSSANFRLSPITNNEFSRITWQFRFSKSSLHKFKENFDDTFEN